MSLAQLFNLFDFKLRIENPMNPALLAAIVALIQEAVTLEPSIAAELQALFSLQNPTPADWEALRTKVLSKTYQDYVPASALPTTPAS